MASLKADIPEDLEYNEFYKALQNQFQALYDRAQSECWLVCIPCSNSLPPFNQINYNFVAAHLMEPSRFFCNEYYALVGGKRKKWTLERDTLKSEEGSLTARVLSEELAYNKFYKQYRVFIIDRPLVEVTQRRKNTVTTSEDLLIPRKSVSEHLNLLECFVKHKEIKAEVDRRIAMFRDNYMVLEGFLKDAAHRIETLVKQAYSSYLIEHSSDVRLQDKRIQDMVWLAVESYIMTQLHSKVYPKICSKFEKESKQLLERCRQLRKNLIPKSLGISNDYNCPYTKTLRELEKLSNCHSSLDKLYCLQDALDSIQKDVHDHFKATLRVGEPAPLPSDDLIALLAVIIVQANLTSFPSDIYYLEHFHWSNSEGDKLSYVLVTFRAALEYVRGPDIDRFLPKPKESSPPSKHSLPLSQTSSSIPPSLLELHEENTPNLSDTLIRLSKLHVAADRIARDDVPHSKKEKSLGPFFERLLEKDGVMSSVDYSPRKK